MSTYNQGLKLEKLKVGVVNGWVILLTLSFLLLGLANIQLPNTAQLGIFIFLIVTTGIPHGATDHWVYHYLANKTAKNPYNLRFFYYYLGTMFFYTLVWLVFPQFSLLFFLLMSAYHFGQSQLYYLKSSEKNLIKVFIYVLWGHIVLLEIFVSHSQESYQILSILISKTQWKSITNVLFDGTFRLSLSVLWMILLIWSESKSWITFREIFQEIILLILLILFVNYASLLLAFGIYFSLWHAVQSIQKEIKEMREVNADYDLRVFIKQAVPFSLISLVAIGALLYIFYQFSISPYLIFFISISVLTLPHMLILQKIYDKKNRHVS